MKLNQISLAFQMSCFKIKPPWKNLNNEVINMRLIMILNESKVQVQRLSTLAYLQFDEHHHYFPNSKAGRTRRMNSKQAEMIDFLKILEGLQEQSLHKQKLKQD